MANRMPRIGRFRDRVMISKMRDVPEGESGTKTEFAPVGQDFASLEPVGETIMQGSVQTGNTITHRMTVRHRTDLTTDHVVDFAGQRYRVKRVTDLSGKQRFTVAMLELTGNVDDDEPFEPVQRTWQ